MTVAMVPTVINGRWVLHLPEHRAARPEWGTWFDPEGREHFGWETERLDSMRTHLHGLKSEWSERPVIVDVGVEEGDLTALYSSWGCDVIMVEPNPRVWPNVRAIWEANHLRPPLQTWVGFAADEDDGPTRDHSEWMSHHVWSDDDVWPRCAAGDVIGDHAFLHLAQHPHVPKLTLDTLVVRNGVHVEAITIDVEGSELAVLRGSSWLLERDQPLVWASLHTDEIWMDENYPRASRTEVIEFMTGHGYEATHLATDHEEHWFFAPPGRLR